MSRIVVVAGAASGADPYDRLAALVAPALDLRAIGALVGVDLAASARA